MRKRLLSTVEAESTGRCARSKSACEMGTAGRTGRVSRRTSETETGGWLEAETTDQKKRKEILVSGGHRGFLQDTATFDLFRGALRMDMMHRRLSRFRSGAGKVDRYDRASDKVYQQTRHHRQGDSAPAEADQPATVKHASGGSPREWRDGAGHYLFVRISMFIQAE